MAKKIVAVTGIKHNNGFYAVGDPVDPAQFTKEELKALHDSGAIDIVDDTKPEELQETAPEPEASFNGPDTSVKTPNTSVKASDASVKETSPAAPTKETPAKK